MKRSFSAPGRYWNLPVRNQGRPVEIRISGRDGAGAYTVQLIPGTPQEFDFIAGCSIPEYFDHELNLECEDESLLENVRCSDVPLGTPHFDAPHRQQLHYSVPFGWQNDPNGLFYYKGLYHLFHQHDPFTSTCGRNPHWHHAVSRDLIHWENRGIAIFPRGNATAYSGSAAVDERNVSGLGEDPATPPILLFYTSASPTGFTQNIAFSTDGGESFRPYPGNPVVPTMGDGDDRDPSIACDPEADEWLMCLFLGEKNWQFGVLRSPDLLHWEEVERFRVPGGCECPDLFRLYDEAETASLIKKVVGVERKGAFMNIAYEGCREMVEVEEKILLDTFKKYGAEETVRFINGILGSFVRGELPQEEAAQSETAPPEDSAGEEPRE